MNWIDGIQAAIAYIEANLTEDIVMEEAAKCACVSPFYFQKAFALLCGFPVGEYIRSRRLTLAGTELMTNDAKIIDLALKYGYDSPDSFTRAFTRFHGVTPTAVRRNGAMVTAFAPLKIRLSLKGGFRMNYKIVEKEAFTVMGVARTFAYDTAFEEVPKFWMGHCGSEQAKHVCGTFGISIDTEMNGKTFDYLIADNYLPWNDIPAGVTTAVIPKFTWAVFSCTGKTPDAIQTLNTNIFSEWLPNHPEYEIAAGYNIEMYSDPADYPAGSQDENYYCEMWIPIRKK